MTPTDRVAVAARFDVGCSGGRCGDFGYGDGRYGSDRDTDGGCSDDRCSDGGCSDQRQWRAGGTGATVEVVVA